MASIGSQKILQREFEQALRDQQDKIRAMLGRNVDPAVLESAEVRFSVLEGLIEERLLLTEAFRTGLNVPDAQLAAFIQDMPDFQVQGKFSRQRYEVFLRSQGLTAVSYDARLRQQLALQQLADTYTQNVFIPNTVVDRFIRLNEQQREVSQAHILIEKFLPQAKVDAAAIRAYYDKHRGEFEVPEQVRLEYLVLSPDVLAPQVQVSPEEIKKYYDERPAEFGQAEERRASHILLQVSPNAGEAEKAAAREKAEQLLKQASQSPGSFADLAKKHSQDTGSAASGGDLGFFRRGAMVKPFEDAVFQMNANEIRGPVQSEFGFHIIKLAAVKPGKVSSLEEVKGKIEQELKKQKAGKKFTEVAESFSNTVYEQGDSLKPAAGQFKLSIQQSPWIKRKGGDVVFPATEKMLVAVFSEEVLKNRRNTEAVEVAPNTLVAARVLDYKPASTRPFEEVSSEIGKHLARNQAQESAVKQGRAELAKLQEGGDAGVAWDAPNLVSRRQPQGLHDAALREVFKADVAKLPAYVGVENPQGGYILVRISRITEAGKIDDAKRRIYEQQLRQLGGQAEFAAYLASLKKKSEIKIRQENLEKKQ